MSFSFTIKNQTSFCMLGLLIMDNRLHDLYISIKEELFLFRVFLVESCPCFRCIKHIWKCRQIIPKKATLIFFFFWFFITFFSTFNVYLLWEQNILAADGRVSIEDDYIRFDLNKYASFKFLSRTISALIVY